MTEKSSKETLFDTTLYDSDAISLKKRFFALIPAMIMTFNTMNTVNTLAIVASTYVAEYDCNAATYGNQCSSDSNVYTCIFGSPIIVKLSCPYQSNGLFIAFLIIWCIYFTVLLLGIYSFSLRFRTNDLRYYLSQDKFKTSIINSWLVRIGIILSIVSALVVIGYSFANDNSSGVTSTITFCLLNAYSLLNLGNCYFDTLLNDELKLEDFPEIVLQKEKNLIPLTSAQLYDTIKIAMLHSTTFNDLKYLQKIGDPDQLKDAMSKLIPLRDDTEKGNDNKIIKNDFERQHSFTNAVIIPGIITNNDRDQVSRE